MPTDCNWLDIVGTGLGGEREVFYFVWCVKCSNNNVEIEKFGLILNEFFVITERVKY